MHAYTPDVAELNLVAKSILLHDAELHGGSGAKHKPLRFLVTVVWCAVPFSYCGLPMIVDTALTDVIHEELDGTEHFVYTNESPHLYGSWARGVPVGVDVVSFSPLSPSFLSSSHLPSLLVSPPLSSRLVSALLNSSLLPSSPLLSSLIISPLLSSLLLSLSSLISSPLSSSLLSQVSFDGYGLCQSPGTFCGLGSGVNKSEARWHRALCDTAFGLRLDCVRG